MRYRTDPTTTTSSNDDLSSQFWSAKTFFGGVENVLFQLRKCYIDHRQLKEPTVQIDYKLKNIQDAQVVHHVKDKQVGLNRNDTAHFYPC